MTEPKPTNKLKTTNDDVVSAVLRSLNGFTPENIRTLFSIQAAMKVAAAPYLTRADVSEKQFHVLLHMRKQQLTPGELGQACGTHSAVMTSMIQTLVQKGLCTKEPHPSGDERKKWIKLTRTGADLVCRCNNAIAAALTQLLGESPADESGEPQDDSSAPPSENAA